MRIFGNSLGRLSFSQPPTMERIIPLIFCASSLACAAQPIITAADAPQPITTFDYHRNWSYSGMFQQCWLIDGPDAEWYLTPTPVHDTTGSWLIDLPANTNVGVSFPNASVAQAALQHPLFFDSVAADGLFRLGEYDVEDSTRFYSDPLQMLAYPCTYGSAWADDFAWSEPLTGTTGQGNLYDTADGYGTIELPWGSMGDVLGIRETVSTWIIHDGDSVRLETQRRRFLRPGYPVDIATIWTDMAYAPGDTIGTYAGSGVGYLGEGGFLSLSDAERTAHPSVIVVNDRLVIGFQGSAVDGIDIIDAAGRSVLHASWRGQAIDVSGLSPGIHLAKLTDDGRTVGAYRFMKP